MAHGVAMISEILMAAFLILNPSIVDIFPVSYGSEYSQINVNNYTKTNLTESNISISSQYLSKYMSITEKQLNYSSRINGWTCYDYSVDFEKNNPVWGTVTISKNARFQGKSHMVNYYFYDNTTMIVYDGLIDNISWINNWQWDYNYYHFWLNNTPVRNYKYLLDNRDVISYEN